MIVNFVSSNQLAPDICSFYFQPHHPVNYLAGQFIELNLPHDNPDGRGQKRWFTLSSSPTEQLLAITTKLSKPSSSFKQALRKLKAGTQLTMAEPMGDFVLPKDPLTPLLFIVGGIGITPLHSMVTFLRDQRQRRNITVAYIVSKSNQLIFTDLLQTYGVSLHTFVNKRPTTKEIIQIVKPSSKTQVYFSGPEPMVESLVRQAPGAGLHGHQLITDYFPGYTQ